MNHLRRSTRPFLPITLVVLAAAVLQVGCLFQSARSVGNAAEKKEGDTAATAVSLSCLGFADAETGVTGLNPLNLGRVVALWVNETDEVVKGQALLGMDDAKARLHVAEEEEGVKAAEIKVNQAEELQRQYPDKVEQQRAAVEVAAQRVEAARYMRLQKKQLLDNGLLNDNEYQSLVSQGQEREQAKRAEEAKLQELKRQNPQLEVTRAKAELAAARARLAEARDTLAECVLKAPCKGKVLRVLVHPGDVITSAARQPAVQFCPAGPQIIRAELMQEYANQVRPGDAAVVTDDVDLETTWRGRVDRIADWYTQRRMFPDDPQQSKDVRTLECLIRLEPGQKEFRIGQRVLVRITPQSQTPG